MSEELLEESKPRFEFFNAYHCDGEVEYKEFINNIDIPTSVAMLVAAVAKAQKLGVYTTKESEVLKNCLTLLVNNNTKEENNEASN